MPACHPLDLPHWNFQFLPILVASNAFRKGSVVMRFFLSRRIQVLFHTWDGHDALFLEAVRYSVQTFCCGSNFGFEMLKALTEKLVKAHSEVLATDNLSLPVRNSLKDFKRQADHEVCLHYVLLTSLQPDGNKSRWFRVFMNCVVAAVHSYHRIPDVDLALPGVYVGHMDQVEKTLISSSIKFCLSQVSFALSFISQRMHFGTSSGVCMCSS
ncbi:putative non-specific serine/threonine protein kinase [Dioscorea sansibarensis]